MGQTKVSLALSYASRGWHVFPIAKGTTNKPRVKWGTAATTDAKTIKDWWKSWPDDNIGLACGPSGLCVVDVDMKKGKNGQATLDALELDYGQLPHTLSAVTPSGGKHLYFVGEARTTVEQIGPGIDTRATGGAGGYVLAPGSQTDVGTYEWAESSQIRVAALPEWLGHMTGRREDREHQQVAVVDQDQPQYIEWAIQHLKHDAKVAIEGSGGNRTRLGETGRNRRCGRGPRARRGAWRRRHRGRRCRRRCLFGPALAILRAHGVFVHFKTHVVHDLVALRLGLGVLFLLDVAVHMAGLKAVVLTDPGHQRVVDRFRQQIAVGLGQVLANILALLAGCRQCATA